MHARAAIRASAVLEDALDRLEQLTVLLPVLAFPSRAPSIVPGARHSQEPAQTLHRKRLPLPVDECEDLSLRSEQNRMAFFRSSCSSKSRACSCSSACRRLTSRGGATFPLRGGSDTPRSRPSLAS